MTHLPQMLRSEDMVEVNKALTGLSSIPQVEAIELLTKLAKECKSEFRARALDGFVRVAPARAASLAAKHLQDSHSFLRVHAIHMIWKLGNRAAASSIASLLESDPDELVRSWAALSLGDLGGASELPALARAADTAIGTNHEGVPIRETAAVSIQQIRSRLKAAVPNASDP